MHDVVTDRSKKKATDAFAHELSKGIGRWHAMTKSSSHPQKRADK